MALVSVVVPTHNRAALLSRTLQSICAQRMHDLEVLVVDDGSTDAADAIGASADPRVRVIRNTEASGVSSARNRGIAEARGAWVAFCDDDDLWSPDKLASQLSAAADAHAAWAYSGDVSIDDSSRVFAGSPPPDPHQVMESVRRKNPFSSGGSNVLVRANVLAVAGGFDPDLCRIEDWDLWLRLAGFGAPACVRRPHVAYRFHRMNIATDLDSMVAEPRWLARRYDIRVDMAAMHRRAAWTALRAGRRREAVRHYARAVGRGDLRSVARIAYALLHPGVGTEAMFDGLVSDPAWVAEAEEWLTPFREPAIAQSAAHSEGGGQ